MDIFSKKSSFSYYIFLLTLQGRLFSSLAQENGVFAVPPIVLHILTGNYGELNKTFAHS